MQQLQSELMDKSIVKYKHSFDCARTVLREEGIRGLYRGLSASLLGLSESTFQFVMYEYFKRSALELRNKNSSDSSVNGLCKIKSNCSMDRNYTSIIECKVNSSSHYLSS
jgi:hypothetical protein